jgi:hypothetical protein
MYMTPATLKSYNSKWPEVKIYFLNSANLTKRLIIISF